MAKITRTLYDKEGKEVKEGKDIDKFRKLSESEKIEAIIEGNVPTEKKEKTAAVKESIGRGISAVGRGIGKRLGKSRKRMRYQLKKPASSFLGEHSSDMFRKQDNSKMFGRQNDNNMLSGENIFKGNNMFKRQNGNNKRTGNNSWL